MRRSDPKARERGYVRCAVARIAGYVPGEQPTEAGLIKLNTNENPYPPTERVATAIGEATRRLRLYPDPSARAVRERVGALLSLDPDGVVVGNGSDELLSILLRAVVDPGDRVAFPVPTYSLYDTLVLLQDGRPVRVPFPDDYSLPPALLETPARMIIVCNPNSPSGTLVPAAVLEELARARSDVLLVIDEAYVDFADETAVGLAGRLANVVVLRTLSKSYSLAGLRVGFALTTGALARELAKVKDSYNMSHIAQAGALAALEDQAAMRRHVEQVRATRARLGAALVELGFSVPPSQANFLLARRPGESLAPLAGALRRRGILVRYVEDVPDGIRITVGTEAEIDALLRALR